MKICIIGAGILGRLIALDLLNRGADITVIDKNLDNTCSMVAAGLLSATSELDRADPFIFHLGKESITTHWPRIVKQLEEPLCFKSCGIIVVSHPKDDTELSHYVNLIHAKNYYPQTLNSIDLQKMEPDLKKFSHGYFFPEDGQIDSQQIYLALKKYLLNHSIAWQEKNISENDITILKKQFDYVIDCRGLGAKKIFPHLRGVRGELLWLHAPEVALSRPVRLMHPRYSLYIAPREKNIYLVGASEIETEDDSAISVKSTLELLTAAYSIHPGFAEARLIKTATQVRPTLPNHLPKIQIDSNCISINGLHRHGYLLSPTIANDISNYITNRSIQHATPWGAHDYVTT